MKLKILGSTSKGNCYILENGDEALILEAGVSFSRLRKALNNNFKHVSGCLVSHAHSDHAGHLFRYAKAGIPVYTSRTVFENQDLIRLCNTSSLIEPGIEFIAGKFSIIPFGLEHDVPCMGFLIDHPQTGRIAFISDTRSVPIALDNVRHIMIECNHAKDILAENIKAGVVHPHLGRRISATHMELDNCKATLLKNDLSCVENIILLHLSDHNSCKIRFKEEVSSLIGKNVFIATANSELELNTTHEPIQQIMHF
jgi:phosphoribosyl 1,2-cyclic phosphodiesterase